tara:strand:+ start:994 stop:2829 length:1836 start_codon:yes stop_codon:yes gene_type:complete
MTKIICEIGINHNGNFSVAKKLIDEAKSSKSWGVKFQYRNLKNFLNKKKNSEIGKEIIDIEIKKSYLSPTQILLLSKYAKKHKLKVGISFFSSRDLKDFKKFKFDFYKVPSPVADNFELIKKLKKINKLLFISFGGKKVNEINKIINKCNLKSKKVILMHCVSNYPVIPENSNLGFIDYLKKKYKRNLIGYSSHDENIFNCLLVLTKKIDFLERHITLDKHSKGLDHSSSSETHDIKLLNFYSENIDKIFFNKLRKNPNQGEIINLQNLGYSYYFSENLKKNSKLKRKSIYLKSPKVGIDDLNLDKYLGKKIQFDGIKNKPLIKSYFQKNNLNTNSLEKFNKFNYSIPIRPHDYKLINKEIKIKNYELHLTFMDVEKFNTNNFSNEFLSNCKFSIHAPDYCDNNNILDLFSENKKIRAKSEKLFLKCIQISRLLKNFNNQSNPIVISISQLPKNENINNFYIKVKKYLFKLQKKFNVKIFPQWLPYYAWYFGGTHKIQVFSNPKDVIFLNKINLNICLDVSHFILSANYFNLDADYYFDRGKKIFKHFHISDAKGLDSEGIILGNGELLNKKFFKKLLKNDKTKVLETWEGHLNNCFNFKKDIKKIIEKIK